MTGLSESQKEVRKEREREREDVNINTKQSEKQRAIIGLLTVVREGAEVRMILSTTPERHTFNGRELVPEVKGRDCSEDVCLSLDSYECARNCGKY